MNETKQPQNETQSELPNESRNELPNESPNETRNELPNEPQQEKGAGAYIATGMLFGLVIGTGMGDLSQGMLIGMALGAAAAAFQGKFGKRMKKAAWPLFSCAKQVKKGADVVTLAALGSYS